MAERQDDGKVHIRCSGCGKRVRYPANQPGSAFRCPICHTVIVAPLQASGDLTLEEEYTGEMAAGTQSDEVPGAPEPEPAAAPSPPPRKAPALERVNVFLVRETERIGHVCEEVVSDPNMPVEEQASKLRALRHAKAVYFKRYVEAVMKDLDRQIAELHDDPASETQTVQNKVKALMLERRGLLVFLNVMYELRPDVSPAQPDATPDTPGNGAAPPTTPSR